MLAAQTFSNFLFVLLFAILFLIPRQHPWGLGIPLSIMALFGLFVSISGLVKMRRAGRAAGTYGISRGG